MSAGKTDRLLNLWAALLMRHGDNAPFQSSNGEFDYSPVQEYDAKGNRVLKNFMSGNWVWKQAVSDFVLS